MVEIALTIGAEIIDLRFRAPTNGALVHTIGAADLAVQLGSVTLRLPATMARTIADGIGMALRREA